MYTKAVAVALTAAVHLASAYPASPPSYEGKDTSKYESSDNTKTVTKYSAACIASLSVSFATWLRSIRSVDDLYR